MGIRYEDLEAARPFMLLELDMKDHYMSPRLTEDGLSSWASLMKDAAEKFNDDWLAKELVNRGLMRSEEPYTRDGITRTRKINQSHAAQQLAEGEFNRYYIRGLGRLSDEQGNGELLIYRGKEVSSPRPESEAKIGSTIPALAVLSALRGRDSMTVDESFGVPSGPNSGLTCKLKG